MKRNNRAITISKLKSHDLVEVDNLMKRHSQTLGFLPREALRDYIDKEGVLGAKTDDGTLTGYLLYATYWNRFRIAQLCVSKDFRGEGIARKLFDFLVTTATTQKVIYLRCRRDFPAHNMWPKLGFVPLEETPGRSAERLPITLWCFTLAPDDQLSVFQTSTSDESIDVIIDANIFFDFYDPDSNKTKPSKTLLSDFLIDALNLWVTDELLVEIDRSTDANQRSSSRQRAHSFHNAEYNLLSKNRFEKDLKNLLPSGNENQESDIRQLAKAAASKIKTFVTRDQTLLGKSTEISNLTNLQVISPTELIIKVHELSERQSYISTPISGVSLEWRRMSADNFALFPFASFLNQNERQGNFREKLESFLASPDRYECMYLRSGDDIVALRVLEYSIDKVLTMHFGRVASSVDRVLFERFFVADIIYMAMEKNLDAVKFKKAYLVPRLIPYLLETGFTENNDSFVRFCFSSCLDRQETLSAITKLCPEFANNYQILSDVALERHCSPLGLDSENQKYFLMPIRSGYAISLVDKHKAASDLFGGEISRLLRWSHVYYRRKTQHKILKPPARLLWYVSRTDKQVVAVSHLDEVVIDNPKTLFKKYKNFGILQWEDLYNMCEGDPSKEIMALKFSHTFPFRKPVSLNDLKVIFKQEGVGLSLQSPLKIPATIFQKLYQFGYPEQ